MVARPEESRTIVAQPEESRTVVTQPEDAMKNVIEEQAKVEEDEKEDDDDLYTTDEDEEEILFDKRIKFFSKEEDWKVNYSDNISELFSINSLKLKGAVNYLGVHVFVGVHNCF